jgi:hypothetical protein
VTVFRRRRRSDEGSPEVEAPVEQDDTQDASADGEDHADDAAPSAGSRADGPWDASEVEDPAEGDRIDLGALLLTGREGMELRLEVDQQTQRVVAVTCVVGQSAVQMQPFAAPRSEGIWREIRAELADGIVAGGGIADEVDGPLGREVRAQVPVQLPDGRAARQGVRFVGVDGPRWFLRGAISGAAYEDAEQAAVMEDIFRSVVVVRGGEAMPPREPLPLRLPPGAVPPGGEAPGGQPSPELNPFARGPEITEIR